MSLNEVPPPRPALRPVFDENRSPAPPLRAPGAGALPEPRSRIEIPLTERPGNRARVVIADDDQHALQAWVRSAEASYGKALDLRTWEPSSRAGHPDLVEQIQRWRAEGWHADLLVIDFNFDDGGRHGVHYLEDLRKEPGLAALPVVLATSNQQSDLEQGQLSPDQGPNKTRESPRDWFKRLKPLQPEAVLYGKTGDAMFLGRVGRGLPDWQRAARRRTWVRLLSEIAEQLDNVRIGVEQIATHIVEFAVHELGVSDAVIGQRRPDGRYRLIALHPVNPHIALGAELQVEEVPVLDAVVKDAGDTPEQLRRPPLLVPRIGAAAAGVYADALADMQLLGAAAVLGHRPVGFIGLFRRAAAPPLDEEVDGLYLGLLVRLLASAIRVDLLRERQTRLLNFSHQASTAARWRHISQYLADILHDEVHHSSDDAGVTVRLIDFGEGMLQYTAHAGPATPAVRLPMRRLAPSVCAEVASANQPRRIGETARAANYLPGRPGMRSELCVPLSVGGFGLDQGGFALGVVNLEHRDPDFYRGNDEDFVAAAAALAASAFQRIRADRLFVGMTEFVLDFATAHTDALDAKLRELLYLFCGYAVLVDLQAPADAGAPWQVRRVHVPAPQGAPLGDKEALCRLIESIYADEWPNTLMGRLVQQRHWQPSATEKRWVEFTKDDAEFRVVELAADGQTQTADAVLWLRHDDADPHRAMLLMWSMPPPIGHNEQRLLGTMAQVFSQLDARKASVDALVHKNMVGEHAALIGHVMQHFRHRIGNLTGSQSTHLDGLEDAFTDQDAAAFGASLERARANNTELADAFHRSQGYIKVPPVLEDVALTAVVEAASHELQVRLQTVQLTNAVPAALAVHTDLDVASLVVYGLLENALDALRGWPDPRITVAATAAGAMVRIVVTDNGPGVALDMRARLFQWGQTSKRDGLGSALAFAQARVRSLGGQLELAAPQPEQGASFVLQLPAAAAPATTATDRP